MILKQSRMFFFSIALLFASSLQAGEIVNLNWYSGVASIAGTSIISPPDPNNDDVVGNSANEFIVYQKHYTGVGPVDIEFEVIPSGGVNEYFVREGVDNSTPTNWSSYRLVLGFGVGADFTQSPSGDGLDFDAPDFNSPPYFSLNFSTVAESEDVLLASGGIHSNTLGFSYADYSFSFDVPDGISKFTLRQQPIPVPEPASWILVLCTGVISLRRRRCLGSRCTFVDS